MLRSRPLCCKFSGVKVACFAALVLCGTAFAQERNDDIVGTWKVASVLDSTAIASMDERQARKLIGQKLVIRTKSVSLGADSCTGPTFNTSWVEPRLYVDQVASMSAENLRLPNPVAVVEMGCTTVFIRQPNRIVFYWGGFFFDAVRQRK